MRIQGTGSAAPAKVLTNNDLAQMVDTSDEWIRTRTGIATRHIAQEETTLSLAMQAAERALDAALANGVERERIGLVICATVSNEKRCPPLACLLQRDLGLRSNLLAFDLNAACSGFIYALIVAQKLVNRESCALIVGVETLSHLMDFTDRNTCVLFGDGAGAAVVSFTEAADSQPLFWVAEAQGDEDLLYITDFIHMDGQGVFKFAVEALTRSIRAVAAQAQIGLEEVDLFICHQANERIIASAAKRLGIPLERFFMNLERYGNTSAASIPIALDEALAAGALRTGAKTILAGFGGGMTAGAVYLIWQ
ncbi:MAG: ketoacyl-ACP synthase III [Coriobacteriia bacterium]|nr:ketoacyl-ACP synthase III [Coriobacteriia bacterium]